MDNGQWTIDNESEKLKVKSENNDSIIKNNTDNNSTLHSPL
jgi:hypothetical protein